MEKDLFMKQFFKKMCWTKAHFAEPLIAPVLDFVCPWFQMGFKSRVDLLPALFLACMQAVITKGSSDVTPAFFTNRGVQCTLYKCLYGMAGRAPLTCVGI